jgi:hypothetical protein
MTAIIYGTPDHPSKRQRKLLRRYDKGGRYHIKAADMQQWIQFGWLEQVIQTGIGFHVASFQLSKRGKEVAYGNE